MDRFRPKRQKVAVACDPCRTRKIKCDGRAPVCEPCQKRSRGAACTWDASPTKSISQVAPDRIQWLEDRIRQLEQGGNLPHKSSQPIADLPDDDSFQNITSNVPDGERATRSYSRDINNQQSSTMVHDDQGTFEISRLNSHAQLADSAASVTSKPSTQRQDISSTVDGVSPSDTRSVAIIGATTTEDQREGFFGSASAGTFMQNVKKLVEQKLCGGQNSSTSLPNGNQPNLPVMVPSNELQQKHIDYILPSRKRADVLMGLYWKFVHELYPFLDKKQVQNDYTKIWSGDDSVSEERSFLCLLNIIFALTSQMDASSEAEQKLRSATVFYMRARELLDVAEMASVRSVQCFLLLGQYFQSTNEPHPCWVFVGLAIRTAQSLGLHLPQTTEVVADIRTKEMLRRVWYGCVLMDNVASMIYGRPSMIGPRSSTLVPFPSALEEDIISLDNVSPHQEQEHQGSLIDCFYYSVKLYEILHDVLFNFHSTTSETQKNLPLERIYDRYMGSTSPSEGYLSVFELERRLARWEISLPPHLRFETCSERNVDNSIFYRQAVILHQRQLHVRLLLLRPVLSTFITTDSIDGSQFIPFRSLLTHRIFLQCAIVCVKVAQDVIDTIHAGEAASADSTETLSVWWYNVLFLYTSATVLIAARLSPSILAEMTEESILERWNKAMDILEGYGTKFGQSIHRLTTTLRLLFDAVPQQYSRLRQNARQNETEIVSSTVQNNHAPSTVPMSFWRPMEQNSLSSSSNFYDPARDYVQDTDVLLNDPFISGSWAEFDAAFDPTDFSWLMTVPVNE